MQRAIVINVLVFLMINANAQPKYFQKTMDPIGSHQHVTNVVNIGNGNFFATGSHFYYEYETPFGVIIDKQGNPINLTEYTTIFPINKVYDFVESDNNHVSIGTTFNVARDTSYIVLQQIDTTCQLISTQFVAPDNLYKGAFCLESTNNNTFTIGGFSIIYTPNYDPWVAYAAKTTATGEVLWQHRYSVDFDTTKLSYIYQILAIPQSSDVFYFGVCDVVSDVNPTQGDIFMARADSSGTILWKQKYNFNFDSRDAIGRAVWTPDQKIAFVGLYGTPTGGRRGLVGKVDTLGNLIWWHALEEIHLVEKFLIVNEGREYVLAGKRYMPPTYNQSNLCIAKTDSSGNVLWARDYGGPEKDYGYCIAPTNDGGYLVMGRKDTSAIGKALVYMVKTNCMGLLTEPQAAFSTYQTGDSPLEVGFQNLSQYVYPDSIDGGYYVWDFGDGSPPFVCGQGYGACPALVTHEYAAQGQYAATLTAFVCTDTATATQQFSVVPTAVGQVAVPTYHISVLPNPASEVLHLEAVGALSSSHELQFSLYDAMGRAVRRLALRANGGSVRLDVADLPQGLYFWTCYSPDAVLQSGRVVIGNE